jgi:hypothetical protein
LRRSKCGNLLLPHCGELKSLDLIGQTNARLRVGKSGCPVFHPSKNRGVPHISLVFREMWDTTNLNLFSDLQKEARGALWYPTSREKRARYGAPHNSWKGEATRNSVAEPNLEKSDFHTSLRNSIPRAFRFSRRLLNHSSPHTTVTRAIKNVAEKVADHRGAENLGSIGAGIHDVDKRIRGNQQTE